MMIPVAVIPVVPLGVMPEIIANANETLIAVQSSEVATVVADVTVALMSAIDRHAPVVVTAVANLEAIPLLGPHKLTVVAAALDTMRFLPAAIRLEVGEAPLAGATALDALSMTIVVATALKTLRTTIVAAMPFKTLDPALVAVPALKTLGMSLAPAAALHPLGLAFAAVTTFGLLAATAVLGVSIFAAAGLIGLG